MRRIHFLSLGLVASLGLFASVATGQPSLQLAAVAGAEQCNSFVYTFGVGSTDKTTKGEVSKLQALLATESKLYPEARVTGYFGPATLAALKRWQAAHRISPTGLVGPQTRAALACKGPPATSPASTTPPTVLPPAQSPAEPAAPKVAPTCLITTEKEIFNFGDKLLISWTSSDAAYVTFISGRSAAAELLIAGSYGPQGSLSVTANVSGTPLITLIAYAKDGTTGTCTKIITVKK